jgi:hypothetical protein
MSKREIPESYPPLQQYGVSPDGNKIDFDIDLFEFGNFSWPISDECANCYGQTSRLSVKNAKYTFAWYCSPKCEGDHWKGYQESSKNDFDSMYGDAPFDELVNPPSKKACRAQLLVCRDGLQLPTVHRPFVALSIKLPLRDIKIVLEGEAITDVAFAGACRDFNTTFPGEALLLTTLWYAALVCTFARLRLENWNETKAALQAVGAHSGKLLVPICRDGNHYVLAVLDVATMQWTHYDSYCRGDPDREAATGELENLRNFFGPTLSWRPDILSSAEVGQQYNEEDAHRPMECRRSGVDCGLFVILRAYAIANGEGTVEQDKMRAFRFRLMERIIALAQ